MRRLSLDVGLLLGAMAGVAALCALGHELTAIALAILVNRVPSVEVTIGDGDETR